MAGHDVFLAALLVQADPQPPPLMEYVAHLHLQGGADTREAAGHQTDECPFPQGPEIGAAFVELCIRRPMSDLAYRIVVRPSTARLAISKPPATAVKNSAHVTSPGRFGKMSGSGWNAWKINNASRHAVVP